MLLATAFLSQELGVHILVYSRLMVLEKMNSPCDIFSNYQVSASIKVDILVCKEFREKKICLLKELMH